MNNNRLIRYCFASLLIVLLQSSLTVAAPVVDSSSATQFVAPTAQEFTDASDLIFNGFGLVPGSIVLSLRSAPSNQVNPGLDGTLPAAVEGADTLEMGVVRPPSASYSCPLSTPVIISIPDWSITLLGASPSPVGAGGGGGGLMDSRDISPGAPATSATFNGAPNPSTIGGASVITQRQYVGTFADLPFLTYIATINAVRMSGSTPAPVQSHYQVLVPTIRLEYDNATCTATVVPSAQAVPAMRLAHLLLLCMVVPIIVRIGTLTRSRRQ